MSPTEFLFILLGLLVVAASTVSHGQGRRFNRRVREASSKGDGLVKQNVSIIVPCKGLDPGLERNLDAILGQDYVPMKVIFVVDDRGDPACGVIQAAIQNHGEVDAKIVLVSPGAGASGKNSALISGMNESKDAEVVVLADSDISPPQGWLRSLVSGLNPAGVGASTGYRWYFPIGGWSAWSHLRSAWTSAGIGVMFDKRFNFAWGGSLAIRKSLFDSLNILEFWRKGISDDYELTLALKRAGYTISFQPKSLAASIEDCTLSQLMEYTNRQILMVRLYDRGLWAYAFSSYTFFNLMTVLGIGALALFPDSMLMLVAGILMMIHLPAGVWKSYARLKTFREYSGLDRSLFDRGVTGHLLAGLLVPWLLEYNLLKSLFIKSLKWRGRRYLVEGARRVRVLGRIAEGLSSLRNSPDIA